MQPTEFWKLIENGRQVAEGSQEKLEKWLMSLLTEYSPEDIIDFELILRRLLEEADHWNVMAAQKIMQGWVTDDSFLYFRCWLISQGEELFRETIKDPDFLVGRVEKHPYCEFELLLYVATEAFRRKTGRQEEDDSFPRGVAAAKGLDYDFGPPATKGLKWTTEQLPYLYPSLWHRFLDVREKAYTFLASLPAFHLEPQAPMFPPIRPLRPEDTAEFIRVRWNGLRLHPAAFGASAAEAPDEEAIRQNLTRKNKEDFILGHFEGDTLAGIVGFVREQGEKKRHKGWIWGMYVEPDYAGRGIGRALLEACLAKARRIEGLEMIKLSVTNQASGALKLYESLGFERWGVEPRSLEVDGQYLDEIHLSKFLDR